MKITGEPEDVLKIVQERVRAFVPDARCELQDYGSRIGCGLLDQWGNVQDVIIHRDHWTLEHVDHMGQVLETKVRTGGSTAG